MSEPTRPGPNPGDEAGLEGAAGEPTDDLGAYRALEEGLGELPLEARVPRDLWPDIQARIEAGGAVEEDGVVPLASHRSRRRLVSLSVLQLVAAGAALAVASGGAVWLALSPEPTSVAEDARQAPGSVVRAVSDPGGTPVEALEEYDQAVSDLERILDEGRQVLGAETVQVIQESLATIDQAIDEAREALADDPGSETLNRLLTRNMMKKIEILRHTAVAIRARST